MSKDLHWYALNYRAASTLDAEPMFQELAAYVYRRIAAETDKQARAVRLAALEEAAKLCDTEHRRNDLTGDYRYGAGICAAAIRSLKNAKN